MTPTWRLYLITDRHQIQARTLGEAVGQALSGGVRAVQLREKDLPLRTLLALATELKALATRTNSRLLVNGRVDVMLASNADGVHLRTDSPPTKAIRRVIGPHKFLGVSTHSLEELARAADEGADFVTFGPIYATPSKARYGPPLGLKTLEAACRRATVPVYALGGVTRARIPEAMGAGAYGVALIAEVMSQGDIAAAARACVEAAEGTAAACSVDPQWGGC